MQISKFLTGVALSAGLLAFGATASNAAKIKLEPFVTGINTPLAMVQPAGDDRMFIAEQTGHIRIVKDGKVLPTPFLNVRSKIVNRHHDFDERGLLGLTFHPDFKNNGKFYVAYSSQLDFQQDLGQMLWWSHTNVVEEYTVSADDPNVANPNSARRITSINWPQFNHNGHWIDFGKDGYLYISTGDGGYANDWGIGHNPQDGNGQDMSVLLGKILRIDVNKTDGDNNYAIPADNPYASNDDVRSEIYASGMRNPWRCSFDTKGGDLICGDVQQNSFEEVSVIKKGGNYGWRRMEANKCFDFNKPDNHPSSCDKAGLTLPVLEYPNCTAQPKGCKGISVTGGYVDNSSSSGLGGKYIFGDWSKSFASMDGQFFVASNNGGKWSMEVAEVTNMSGTLPYVLAFAQDNSGQVYALTSVTTGPNGYQDVIYKVVAD